MTLAAAYSFQYNARQWLTGHIYRIKHGFKGSAGGAINPKRVLLVMTGLIGDTVMSTPVVIEARRLWPDAHISLLVNGTGYELLFSCPLVDFIKRTTAMPFSLRNRQGVKSLRDWIKDRKFDIAIILLGDQFASLLAEAQVPVRVGVARHFLTPCLTHSYEIGSARTWGPTERLNALRALEKDVREISPLLWVADDARNSARRILSEFGVQPEDSYVVIHPFGSSRHQWWPVDRVSDVATDAWNCHRLKTLVVGGPELRGASGSPLSR